MGGAAAGWDIINNFVIPPTTSRKDWDTLFRTPPDIEQSVIAPADQEQCQNLPGLQSGQKKGSASNDGCEAAAGQIVWPLSCQRTAKQIALEGVLKGPSHFECHGAESVFFWSGAFTKDQTDLVTSTYKGLVAAGRAQRTRLSDGLTEVKKNSEARSWNFISTAPGAFEYAYFCEGKWPAKITVFALDTRFNEERQEFANTDISWIYEA